MEGGSISVLAAVLFASTIVSTECAFVPLNNQPEECRNAINLTESWRSDHNASDIKPHNGTYNCDTSHMIDNGRPWFRFSGQAGNVMSNKCPPNFSCGAVIGLWTDEPMPQQVGVVSSIRVYGSYLRFCKSALWGSKRVSVLRCSSAPEDVVYRYDDVSADCYFGFCGMHL